jgi:hypothetical protein
VDIGTEIEEVEIPERQEDVPDYVPDEEPAQPEPVPA